MIIIQTPTRLVVAVNSVPGTRFIKYTVLRFNIILL